MTWLNDGPERLTPRARAYLLGVALQHATIGGFALCDPKFFASPSFDGIKAALPFLHPDQSLRAWACILLFVAAICVTAALVGSDGAARAALLGSVAVEGIWLGGYLASWQSGVLLSPVGLAAWAAMVWRDLTMLRNPLRNPFEGLVRRLLEEPDDAPAHDAAA